MNAHEPRPVAVITGASAGIGAATAVELARRGHDLVISARRRAPLAEVAARATEAAGRPVRTEIVPLDVTVRGHSAELLDAAERA
ncbi:MAG: SDR family NAD(P)-dependent oxidoreductase, partial [Phycisphaerales bacterium]